MHHISKLIVQNFRSIKSAEFSFTGYTPLVGYNNAGKSNILRALQWALEFPSLGSDSFYDSNEPVFVVATVSGIDDSVLDGLAENHRGKIEKFVSDGELTIRRTQLVPKTKPLLEIRAFENDQEVWAENPTGIAQALTALFPEVIFVGAMEDSAEDVAKNASGTTIGKLMKEIIDPIREDYEEKIFTALSPIQERLSSDSPNKDERLIAVDEAIQNHLHSFFPDVLAKTQISMPTFDDVTKKATLKIFEQRYGDDRENDASSMGHGAQRSIQISLINALSDIKRQNQGNAARTVLLLVDEPELYLHPQAISVARSALRKLSEQGYQVTFSTHAGDLIGYSDAPQTLIVRRTKESGTIAVPSLLEQVEAKIGEAEKQAALLFELSNSREFLFCDRVFLVEGATEKFLLPHLYEYIFGASIAERRTGLMRVEGSGNIPNCKRILEAMGVETRSIADLDFLLRGGLKAGYLGVDDPRRLELLDIARDLAEKGAICVSDDGWPKKGNGKTAEEAFAVLASDERAIDPIADLAAAVLEEDLWIWTKGAIEKHLSLSGKSPTIWKNFVDDLWSGRIDHEIDVEGIRNALSFSTAD